MTVPACPFCVQRDASEIVALNELAYCRYDKYPVNKGHALIISFRHVSDPNDLSEEEQLAIFRLLKVVRAQPAVNPLPQGFNVGWNVGEAAGQTVDHAHLHVIPRYVGDVDDPFGGIRGVIPARRRYE